MHHLERLLREEGSKSYVLFIFYCMLKYANLLQVNEVIMYVNVRGVKMTRWLEIWWVSINPLRFTGKIHGLGFSNSNSPHAGEI